MCHNVNCFCLWAIPPSLTHTCVCVFAYVHCACVLCALWGGGDGGVSLARSRWSSFDCQWPVWATRMRLKRLKLSSLS